MIPRRVFIDKYQEPYSVGQVIPKAGGPKGLIPLTYI